MGKFVSQLNLKFLKSPSYPREPYQSFMTASEWRNVEIAEELAKFMGENHSIFQFPYLRQVWDLWKIVFKSYAAARKYHSHRQILFSEYMLMSLFVAVFTTLEMIPRGIISLILYPFLPKTNPSRMQKHLSEYFTEYAKKLASIPFYDHDYRHIRQDLSQKYRACQQRTWVDWFTWKVVAFELFSREWLSKPLRYWFHQEGNAAPSHTEVCVKYQAKADDSESAKRELQMRLEGLNQDLIQLVPGEIYAKEEAKLKNGQLYLSTYARIKVPRYTNFLAALAEMGSQGIAIRKIAGQERVQMKCHLRNDSQKPPSLVTPLYDYSDRIHPQTRIGLFDAPVRDLHRTVAQLDDKNFKVHFVHNF